MRRIAVLLTCHNRVQKTKKCLQHLKVAIDVIGNEKEITIYLTDDGSTDGTREMIIELFPEINLIQGNGKLYWAGGMRSSWNEALKIKYDAYLLLNDDTYVYKSLFTELIKVHTYALNKFNMGGIYIGSTFSSVTNKLSYGGSLITNRFLNTSKRVIPDGSIQKCDLGNANIMLVTHQAVETVGILSKSYTHGVADYDYTLKAIKYKVPVLVAESFCGECINDNVDKYFKYSKLPLIGRIKFLYHPLGLGFKDKLNFMKRNFPYRVPFVFFMGWFKALFPNIYIELNRLRA